MTTAASAMIRFRHSPFPIVHLAHPRPVRWTEVIEPVAESLDVDVVPWNDWLAALAARARAQATSSDAQEAKCNPATLLLSTYSAYADSMPGDSRPARGKEVLGAVLLDTRKAARVEPLLAKSRLPQIRRKDVDLWLGYWRRAGFLRSADSRVPADGQPCEPTSAFHHAFPLLGKSASLPYFRPPALLVSVSILALFSFVLWTA